VIYLDHHATTPVAPEVLAAMLPYFGPRFGNPSSRHHALGEEARRAVEEARQDLSALVGAAPEEIVFTSGATESDNLAVRGAAHANAERGRHLVTTVLEHPAVLEPCRSLERAGFEITRVPVSSEGVVDVDDVARALRRDTILVSVMAANNEIGTLQPMAALGALCRERGILFHSDAVQAIGRVPVDVGSWCLDLMSLSAHKMYGPKGTGALYVRRGRRPRVRLEPQAEGGGQEGQLRAGTLNVPGIVGFGCAARLAGEALQSGEPERMRSLRDRLFAALRAKIGGLQLNGTADPRLPGNLHVSIEGAEAETLLLSLADRFAVSTGAACAEAGGKGSHVLRAIGIDDARIYTALRFGIGRYNTVEEIDAVVDALARAVREARSRTSPVRD
jgi:cysteine desulfurase